MLQELPMSIRTREMSKLVMVIFITQGNISFEIPSTFSLSRNPRIGIFGLVAEVAQKKLS